jgi:putative copper export protein
MDALVKASLYLGTVLLVGAGGYKYFIARSENLSRRLLMSVVIGFLLVSVGSVANLVLTLMNVLGRFDINFIWQYATNTQHGRMTFARLGLAFLLVPFILIPRWRPFFTVLFSLASLGLLGTFSALSHAATMAGTPAFVTDLIHMCSASLWVGAILFSVLDKSWKEPNFETTMKRVSTLALICVALLVGTGIYASQIHMKSFDLLLSTAYGRVLLVKLALFSLTLVLAAFNRWYFMPRFLARKNVFQKMLLTEVFLLLAVLVVTGLLTVSELPHDMTR